VRSASSRRGATSVFLFRAIAAAGPQPGIDSARRGRVCLRLQSVPPFLPPSPASPLFVFVTARTWASPICQRNTDRRLPSISFNPAGQRLTPHGGERSPLPFLSSSARSLSHASSPVGQSLLLLPLPLRERAWWLPQGQLAAAGGLESFNQQTRKNNTDQQRDETEPYQEMVQRFRTTCRNCNPSKRTLLF
jgi:hypothetical protein